jgi:hypothetical protein
MPTTILATPDDRRGDGQHQRRARLYSQVAGAAPDFAGRLHELSRARRGGADPADVHVVEAALVAVHARGAASQPRSGSPRL